MTTEFYRCESTALALRDEFLLDPGAAFSPTSAGRLLRISVQGYRLVEAARAS